MNTSLPAPKITTLFDDCVFDKDNNDDIKIKNNINIEIQKSSTNYY